MLDSYPTDTHPRPMHQAPGEGELNEKRKRANGPRPRPTLFRRQPRAGERSYGRYSASTSVVLCHGSVPG